MAAPRSESTLVRGWRAEFRLWWSMAKHVEVIFDKSRPPNANFPNAGPGSISMCLSCCQILSTRSCSGGVTETAQGCEFHQRRPEVPIAVRSTITSVRLREMLKPNMIVQCYFLGRDISLESETAPVITKTDLMDVSWVQSIRSCNKEVKRSKKVYVHDEQGCIHSNVPDSIVQGFGPRSIYFKRCDGQFVNAFGEQMNTTVRGKEPCRLKSTERRTTPCASLQRESNARPLTNEPSPVTGTTEPCTITRLESETITAVVGETKDDTAPAPDIQAVGSFNDRSNPWTAINFLNELSGALPSHPGNEQVAAISPEISVITDATDAFRSHCEQQYPKPSPDEFEADWKDVKEPTALTTDCINPSTIDSGVRAARSITDIVTTSQLAITQPSTFLMPYEYAAAKQVKFELPQPAPLPVEMNIDPAKLAELAWRRLNLAKVAEEAKEEADEREARRARKRRWLKLWH